jgi:hypothetical protein
MDQHKALVIAKMLPPQTITWLAPLVSPTAAIVFFAASIGGVRADEHSSSTAMEVNRPHSHAISSPYRLADRMNGARGVRADECAAHGGQLSTEGRRYPFAIRLGALLSPRTKFAGGVDVTFPSLGLAPGWVGRADAEAIVSANFGGISTLVPVTFDEVYYAPERSGAVRFYGGGGIGPYFGEVTRFGGKLFVGANFSRQLSGEVGVHFAGRGDALVTAQIRIPL